MHLILISCICYVPKVSYTFYNLMYFFHITDFGTFNNLCKLYLTTNPAPAGFVFSEALGLNLKL